MIDEIHNVVVENGEIAIATQEEEKLIRCVARVACPRGKVD